jgi:zinc protease
MTTGELRSEYTRRFRPEQSILTMVGDFDAGAVRAQKASASSNGLAPQDARPGGPIAHAVTVVPRPGSVQTTLLLGGFGPLRGDADYEAAEVANAVYGGTFTSRLVQNIREDKGYTYSPGSSLVTLRQAGLVQTRADIRNPVTGASLNEILYELNRMVTTAPTQEELERAKRYLLGTEAVSLQSRAEAASEYSSLWLDGMDAGALAESLRKLEAIQLEEVEAAARKYFQASHMAIIAVGDEKVIHEQLAPFALPFHEEK